MVHPVVRKAAKEDLLLALLVCNRAGGLASRLAGGLALAAAALGSGFFQVSLVQSLDVFHDIQ